MKYITITSSNLSKYTGHNKYESNEKIVNELLKKCGIEDRYVPKSNTEDSLSKLSPEELINLKKELKLPSDTTIDQLEKVIKYTIMNKSLSPSLSEEQSKQMIDAQTTNKPILQLVSQGIKQDLRMKRGNIKEQQNLNKIQLTKKVNITQGIPKCIQKNSIDAMNMLLFYAVK